jgi:hypothetical protein
MSSLRDFSFDQPTIRPSEQANKRTSDVKMDFRNLIDLKSTINNQQFKIKKLRVGFLPRTDMDLAQFGSVFRRCLSDG